MGIAKENVYSVKRQLSYAEETLNGHVVKKYVIEELVGKDNFIVGYRINEFYRDVNEPNWEDTALKPVGFGGIVVKRKGVLEDVLASMVPDETYEGTVIVHFHWVDVDD